MHTLIAAPWTDSQIVLSKPELETNESAKQAFASWAQDLVFILYLDPAPSFTSAANQSLLAIEALSESTSQLRDRAQTINQAYHRVDGLFFESIRPIIKKAVAQYGHVQNFRANFSCLIHLLDTQACLALDVLDFTDELVSAYVAAVQSTLAGVSKH